MGYKEIKRDLLALAASLNVKASPSEGFEPEPEDNASEAYTRQLQKEYDKRGEGKGAQQNLLDIIKAYDEPGFVRWVEVNQSDNTSLSRNDEVLGAEENAQVYQSLMKHCSKGLGPIISSSKEMPFPLCGSQLERYSIKVPSELLKFYDTEELLDEYFGVCYQAYREEARFVPGGFALMMKLIKQRLPDIGSILTSKSDLIQVLMSMSSPSALNEIYGPEAVENWISKNGIPASWKDSAEMEGWLEELGYSDEEGD
jgi:hypothetical protein